MLCAAFSLCVQGEVKCIHVPQHARYNLNLVNNSIISVLKLLLSDVVKFCTGGPSDGCIDERELS